MVGKSTKKPKVPVLGESPITKKSTCAFYIIFPLLWIIYERIVIHFHRKLPNNNTNNNNNTKYAFFKKIILIPVLVAS